MVTQLKPITVVFALPEDQIPPIIDQMHAGKTLAVTAYDRSHTTQLATGMLQSIDSQIDTTTGTVKLKAVFPNPDEKLFPNQFVNVDLLVNTLQGATLIPQSAVQRGAPGTYVYVVNSGSDRERAQGHSRGRVMRPTSPCSRGSLRATVVVIDGADRLKDGAKITVRPGAGAQGRRTHFRPSPEPDPRGTPGTRTTPTPARQQRQID